MTWTWLWIASDWINRRLTESITQRIRDCGQMINLVVEIVISIKTKCCLQWKHMRIHFQIGWSITTDIFMANQVFKINHRILFLFFVVVVAGNSDWNLLELNANACFWCFTRILNPEKLLLRTKKKTKQTLETDATYCWDLCTSAETEKILFI